MRKKVREKPQSTALFLFPILDDDYRNMDKPKDQTLLPTGLPILNLSKPFDPAVFALNFRTNLSSCKRLGITI